MSNKTKPSIKMIVAKYKEDVSWLSKCTKVNNFVVYDKSGESNPEYIPLENIGREAHTYLHHIINNYDNLDDIMIFSQGYPFDHCPTFIEDLDEYLSASEKQNYKSFCKFPFTIQDNYEVCFEAFHKTDPRPIFKDFLEKIFHKKDFGIVTGHFCALFALKKQVILKYSKEFYIYLSNLNITFEYGPWLMERVWCPIFEFQFNTLDNVMYNFEYSNLYHEFFKGNDELILIFCSASKYEDDKFVEFQGMKKYGKSVLYFKEYKYDWFQSNIHLVNYIIGYYKNKFNLNDVIGSLGFSMGGFGAILFGCLWNVKSVVAFCPQTNINKQFKLQYLKSNDLAGIVTYEGEDSSFCDLKPIIEKTTNTKINIHTTKHQWDVINGKHVSLCKAVNLKYYESMSHQLPSELKQSNILDLVIEHDLEIEPHIVISLGWNCGPSMFSVSTGMRKRKVDGYKSCPFDTMINNYEGMIRCIQNDFKHFCDPNYLCLKTIFGEEIIYNNYYKFWFNHESPGHTPIVNIQNWERGKYHFVENNFERFIARYTARINNFMNYLKYKRQVTFIINRKDSNINDLKAMIKQKYPNVDVRYKIVDMNTNEETQKHMAYML